MTFMWVERETLGSLDDKKLKSETMMNQKNFQIWISFQWRIVCRILICHMAEHWKSKNDQQKSQYPTLISFYNISTRCTSRLSGSQEYPTDPWHIFIHPQSCLDPELSNLRFTKGLWAVANRTPIAKAGLGLSSTVCVWVPNIYFWVILRLVLKPYAIYTCSKSV